MPDMTLAGFIAFLANAPHEIEEASHRGLEKAARIVEAEAKREIGTYQGQAGPFAAWAELTEATKADRVAKGFTENDPLLRTGDMRDTIGHRVAGHEAVVGSDSDIAVYQELGTSRIPPRSFLGGAAFRKAEEVAQTLGHAAVLGLVGRGGRTGDRRREGLDLNRRSGDGRPVTIIVLQGGQHRLPYLQPSTPPCPEHVPRAWCE